MSQDNEEIILYTDDAAANGATVTGWVSRNNHFYGIDEHAARYDGCTHRTCECGNIMEKRYILCESCRAKAKVERYNALEFKEWHGVSPVCIYGEDNYFFSEEALQEFCDENEVNAQDLMLVLCKPNYLRPINSDYWSDCLREDGDIPDALKEKVDELNKFISELEPQSWSESNIRTSYSYTPEKESE